MADITIGLNDTLEFDTIIQQDSSATNPVGTITEINEGSTHNNDLNGFQTKTAVFDPSKSGTFKIPVNGQQLTVKVIDNSNVSESEANEKLIHRWILNDMGGTVEDDVGSATGNIDGVKSVNGDWMGGSAYESNGTTDYIKTTTLGSFGSNMDSDFALSFSAKFESNGVFGMSDDMAFNVFSDGSGGTVGALYDNITVSI
jgi:hypothetical protein